MKWNDNSTVTVASNYYGVSTIHKVERRVKKENKKLLDYPYLIHMYNKGMGGIDVCDRTLSSYRPRLRSTKWWWIIFSNMLYMAAVAAFRFYQHIGGQTNMSHTMFKRKIAGAMINTQEEKKRGPSSQPAKAVVYDGVNHFLNSCTQSRCCFCMKNT